MSDNVLPFRAQQKLSATPAQGFAELAAATNFSFLRGASTAQDMVLSALLLDAEERDDQELLSALETLTLRMKPEDVERYLQRCAGARERVDVHAQRHRAELILHRGHAHVVGDDRVLRLGDELSRVQGDGGASNALQHEFRLAKGMGEPRGGKQTHRGKATCRGRVSQFSFLFLPSREKERGPPSPLAVPYLSHS